MGYHIPFTGSIDTAYISPMEANHCEPAINLTIRTDGLLLSSGFRVWKEKIIKTE